MSRAAVKCRSCGCWMIGDSDSDRPIHDDCVELESMKAVDAVMGLECEMLQHQKARALLLLCYSGESTAVVKTLPEIPVEVKDIALLTIAVKERESRDAARRQLGIRASKGETSR